MTGTTYSHQRSIRRRTINAAWLRLLSILSRFSLGWRLKIFIEKKLIQEKCRYLFDDGWYAAQDGVAQHDPVFPLMHFIKHGAAEYRDPHRLFEISHYLSQVENYPPGVNPLVHFALVGKADGLSPTPWFDNDYYLACNPDVQAGKFEPFDHFVRFGVNENRLSVESFSPFHYIEKYPDVGETHLSALYHYLDRGMYEGRQANYSAYSEPGEDDLAGAPDDIVVSIDDLADSIRRGPRLKQVSNAAIDVIVPVYKNTRLTLTCIRSVLECSNIIAANLIVIDDCSPESGLTDILRDLSDTGCFELIRHSENLGFVKTVNRGMKIHPDRDVILLNSDTEVFGNWIDRLHYHAYSSPNVATVCPLTNSGTICSYPHTARDNSIPKDCTARELDAIARVVNEKQAVDAPTAVGFCMYIRRDAIQAVGYFDEVSFGTGYGEENDFCLRGRQAGLRDLIAADVFVRHFGSASFQDEKAERVVHAMRIIGRRYPTYHHDVKMWIKQDPLRSMRARIDHQRLLRQGLDKTYLIVSHSRGGGTERHVQERISSLKADGFSVFRLSPGRKHGARAMLRHADLPQMPNLRTYQLDDALDQLQLADMLKRLNIRDAEFHHFIDFGVEATDQLISVVERAGIEYDVVLHDYFSICPRVNLAYPNGDYCGEPDVSGCQNCLSRHGSEYGSLDIQTWRSRYQRCLSAAREVVAPHHDVADRIKRYFPELEIQVHEHDCERPDIRARGARPADKVYRIGTIGAISPIKGLNLMKASAAYALKKKLPIQLVVVGYTSNDLASKRTGIEVTGRYDGDHLMEEIEKAELDAILIASTWPETWSYTLSEAFRTGLPVISLDIGAPAARIREHDAGLVLPLELSQSPEKFVHTILEYVSK